MVYLQAKLPDTSQPYHEEVLKNLDDIGCKDIKLTEKDSGDYKLSFKLPAKAGNKATNSFILSLGILIGTISVP